MDLTGFVGFSTCNSFVSKAIRYFSHGTWSHTFLCLGEHLGEELILEASTYEVRIAPLSRFYDKGSRLELWQPGLIDRDTHIACMRKAMLMVGRGYGYFQLIGFIWPWVLHRVGIRASNPFWDGVICSELVGAELIEARYLPLVNDSVNDITPDTIDEAFHRDGVSIKKAVKEYGECQLSYL